MRSAPTIPNKPLITYGRLKGWELGTPNGGIEASQLVLAASFWTRELALKIGMDLPLFAVEHQAFITNAIPELISREGEVPTIRDSSAPCNIRQDGKSPLIGIYEREPKFRGADGIPPDFVQELLPPDLDRLEEHLELAKANVPALGRCGIKSPINGPTLYARWLAPSGTCRRKKRTAACGRIPGRRRHGWRFRPIYRDLDTFRQAALPAADYPSCAVQGAYGQIGMLAQNKNRLLRQLRRIVELRSP